MSLRNVPSCPLRSELDRRKFLRLMLWAGAAACLPNPAFAGIDAVPAEERFLSLYNPLTKERFEGVFWRDGAYDDGALQEISYLMRDTRAGAVKEIDGGLLQLISAISMKTQSRRPLHVICGYRTPKTNALLLKYNKSAAKNSYHLYGQAADIRLPGLKTLVLRRAAYGLHGGGVGYYPRRGFVHVDVGPVRYWTA